MTLHQRIRDTMQTLPQRADLPTALTWDVSAIYPDETAWESEFTAIAAELPAIVALRGTLGTSAVRLAAALTQRDAISERIGRLSAYARLRSDENTANAQFQALTDRVSTLVTQLRVALAPFTPEILAIPPATLDAWLAANPALALYRHELADLVRERDHIRSDEIEAVLAGAGDIAQGPAKVFTLLANADLRLPAIIDENGDSVKLSLGNYGKYMQSNVRSVRQAAYEGMHTTFKAQQNTLAALYSTHIKQNSFYARQRHYGSTLEAALSAHNIPTSVYTNLVTTARNGLPVLHRYLKLRGRILGLSEQHMYDLPAPLVPQAQSEIPYDAAREQVIAALAPLGADYVAVLRRGLTERWVDVLENEGKRGGAYSMGVYGVHPFVLLNYQSELSSVFTLAHELGHSLHSHYTSATQPYPYAHYTIFIGEIASTFNEALLTNHLLHTATDTAVRMNVLNDYLESYRTTFFRQIMFADFEMQAHARAEAGEALTPDLLCGIYRDLNQQYYGAGGIVIDELTGWEWSRIPHFYRSFYVYQYATGIAASTALARAVLTEGQPAVDRYLTLLKSGASNYTIDLLKHAGVDMTTPAPVEAAITEFDRAIGEMEALVG